MWLRMKSSLWVRSKPSLDSRCWTTLLNEVRVVLGFVSRRRDSKDSAMAWSDTIVVAAPLSLIVHLLLNGN